MAATRQSDFKIQDFTTSINKIPRPWSKITDMGMFEEKRNTSEDITIDILQEKTNTFGDSVRGGARNKVGSEATTAFPLKAPFFTLDGAIRPVDLQGLRESGTANSPATVANARLRIMNRIRRYHGALKEKVLAEAIQGRNFVPNATTPAYDYYTLFNQTKKTVDFAFSSASTDIVELVEEGRAHIVDNAQDEAGSYETVVLASRSWFSKFIGHPKVKGAYEQYASNSGSFINPNRDRPNGNMNNREFIFQNTLFIEYGGAFGGTFLIEDEKAFMFPRGIENMFELNFAPGDLIDAVNQIAQDLYMIEKRDHRSIIIETDTSMLGVNTRPELVVELTNS